MKTSTEHVAGACCDHGHGAAAAPGRPWPLITTVTSGVFVAAGLLCNWLGAPEWAGRVTLGIAVVAGGWFILPRAISAARRFSADMNLLMSIAVAGAIFIGAWNEAAMVTFLFSLAELLESYSVRRARRAIRSLMELAPETAWLQRDGSIMEVPATSVRAGDIIVIKPGARLPLDGVVVAGESSVNQAPITGESMPAEKMPGSDVFAGSINQRGSLTVRVTRLSTESTLARMIHLVEEAQSQKAPAQRFVDVFAHYYTPAVICMAIVIAVAPPLLFHHAWVDSFYRALVMLVIACPCALVIATPVSVVSALTAAARRGVLIKGGAVLESLGKLTALALDKTGTITEGRPRVAETITLNGSAPAEVLRIAAALEARSEHPLANAILRHAEQQNLQVPDADQFQSITGRGIEGVVEGHHYFAGNHRLVEDMAVCSPETELRIHEIERRALTAVVVGHRPHADCKGHVLGVIGVGDTVRAQASATLQRLRDTGIRRIVMLTGDNRTTAEAIAAQVGIDEVMAELLPEEKLERVRELLRSEKNVGMVGDGVNDAPSLAAATVGIAMGVAGTDAALESADVALMADDLNKLPEAIALGRRAERVIITNIAVSIGLKVVFLGLAAAGIATMWMAVAADMGLTLLVIGNALRLLKSPSPA
jgi:Zn2+/Cd2+-exporting ATPase